MGIIMSSIPYLRVGRGSIFGRAFTKGEEKGDILVSSGWYFRKWGQNLVDWFLLYIYL